MDGMDEDVWPARCWIATHWSGCLLAYYMEMEKQIMHCTSFNVTGHDLKSGCARLPEVNVSRKAIDAWRNNYGQVAIQYEHDVCSNNTVLLVHFRSGDTSHSDKKVTQ